MPRSNRPRPRTGPRAAGRKGTGRQGTGRQGTGRQGPARQGAGGRPAGEFGSGEPLDPAGVIAGGRRTEEYRGGRWVVRPVSGSRAVKPYRCPGCSQQIPAGVPHVVVWPFDGPVGLGDGVGDRRHWHTPCWAARERRTGR